MDLEKLRTVFEIVKSEPLGNSKVGIYKFQSRNSPSSIYLLLKHGKRCKILDPYEISRALEKAVLFLRKYKISESQIALYAQEILIIYKGNRYDSKSRM